MYKAIYRKYRPRTFKNVVGQKHVVTTLQNAIAQQKIGHAYLFYGLRGTGKTSIAKIFAEAVNCLGEGIDKPCHECQNCLLIDSEKATDIIELDAASNNGVDEIRQIREFARYAPTQLKYKVYIIDEVHMLSTAAFNALLKTLEEPPAHVIFILATTEIHKIPQTIISRCQRFDFKKVTVNEMISCIEPILVQEEIEMDSAALTYLAEYADGGMRDALSVLDQVSAYSSGIIGLNDIQDVIGTVGVETYEKLVDDVLQGNSRDILVTLDEIVANGKNIQLFVEEFLKFLLGEIEKNLQGNSRFDARILFFMLEKMNKLAAEMKTAFLPQVALQALFLEITYDSENDETTQYILQQQNNKKDGQQSAPLTEEKTEASPQQQVNIDSITEQRVSVERKEVVEETLATELPKQKSVLERTEDIDMPIETQDFEKQVAEVTTSLESEVTTPNPSIAQVEFENSVEPEVQETTSVATPVENGDVLALFDADNFNEQEELYTPQDEYIPEELMVKNITQPEVEAQSEITTIFDEIDLEKKQEQTKPEKVETSESLAAETDDNQDKLVLIESLNDEKRRLLLQRIMAEVVIYPEFNQLERIKRKWQLIKFDPTNQIAIMLLDMEPKIATKQEIVLSCYNKALANQLQIKANKVAAEQFISELIGQPYEVIAIDEGCWSQERAKFSDKWRANEITQETIATIKQDVLTIEEQAQAQGYEYVTLDFDETEPEEEAIIQEAKALFGEELVEVEE